jgi:hypothetical protein
MMRAAIEMATTRFSSDRMVRDYFAHLYGSPPAGAPLAEPHRTAAAAPA